MIISQISKNLQKLIIWEWDKLKKKEEFDINFEEVNSFFFHPIDDHIFIMGKNFNSNIPYKTYINKNDKIVAKQDIIKDNLKTNLNPFIITCHLIFNDNSIIFGNNKGELIYMTNHYELKSKLPTSPGEGYQIECLTKYNKGFLAGCNNGSIFIFERKDKDVKYPYEKLEKKIFSEENQNFKINSMILVNNINLIVGYTSGYIINYYFSKEKLINEENLKSEPLLKQFHTKSITCIDLCERKPLFVTGSIDRYIKIWNYIDYSLEVSKKFESEIISVAFHPNGFNLAIGFKDKIKLVNILIDEIKVFKDFIIKNGYFLKFSNGGHYLAVCSSSNLYIYSFYKGEQLGEYIIRKHDSAIKELIWDESDTKILTIGLDGKVNEFILEKKFTHELHMDLENKEISSFDLIINEKGEKDIVCNTVDEPYIYLILNRLKDIKDKNFVIQDNKNDLNREIKKIDTGNPIIDLKIAKKINHIFMSSDDGYLRCYKYPFTNEMSQMKFH